MKKYLPSLIVLLIIGGLYLVSRNIPQDELQAFIIRLGIWGPIVFVLLTLATYVLAPLSGTPLLFIGYYLYGDKVVFLTTIAGFISFTINFWLARIWGRPLVERMVGKKGIGKIDELTQEYGLGTLFFLRIFQGSIHDFLSIAAGLTNMKYLSYITVSGLAIIPGTAMWYYLSKLVDTPSQFTILTTVWTVLFSSLYLVFRYFQRKKASHS